MLYHLQETKVFLKYNSIKMRRGSSVKPQIKEGYLLTCSPLFLNSPPLPSPSAVQRPWTPRLYTKSTRTSQTSEMEPPNSCPLFHSEIVNQFSPNTGSLLSLSLCLSSPFRGENKTKNLPSLACPSNPKPLSKHHSPQLQLSLRPVSHSVCAISEHPILKYFGDLPLNTHTP